MRGETPSNLHVLRELPGDGLAGGLGWRLEYGHVYDRQEGHELGEDGEGSSDELFEEVLRGSGLGLDHIGEGEQQQGKADGNRCAFEQ